MMKLTINGIEAELKADTTFKLVRENPYFSENSDYTFDVALPLRECPQNRLIFGLLDRPEVAHADLLTKKYNMQLICPPIILAGIAIVTACNANEVKVQLKGGTTGLLNVTEATVNRIGLGKAWDSLGEIEEGGETWNPGVTSNDTIRFFHYASGNNPGNKARMLAHGTQSQTDSVCFPILSTTDELVANPWTRTNLPNITARMAMYMSNAETQARHPQYTILAPQPYLLDIMKRVVKAIGYKVGDWEYYNTDRLAWGLFIANSRGSMYRADALPEWTLSEFFNELQNFFGCVFVVRDGKTVDMIPREYFYKSGERTVNITEIVDDWEVEHDSEGESIGSSDGNVDYDWPEVSTILRLPDEVWEHADRLECKTYEEVEKYVNQMSEEDKETSPYLFHVAETDKLYALLHNTATEKFDLYRVGQFEPLWRRKEKRDIDTNLRIVPASWAPATGFWSEHDKHSVSTFYESNIKNCVPILKTTDVCLTNKSVYSIDAAINPNTPDNSQPSDTKKEVMEVAYNCYPYCSQSYGIPYYPAAIGQPYMENEETLLPDIPPFFNINNEEVPLPAGPFTLCKNNVRSETGTVGDYMTVAPIIDTRTTHIFTYVGTGTLLDPSLPYLIRGRRYACRKLEITIDHRGIQPIVRGYFFELT